MRRKNEKILKIIFIIFFIIFLCFAGYYFLVKKNFKGVSDLSNIKNVEEKIDYNEYFKDIVKTSKDKTLYVLEDEEFKEIGKVSSDIVLSLSKDDHLDKGYFKIKDSDYYIDYKDIEESEESVVDLSWKNYVPYNLSVKTTNKTDLYLDGKLIYSFNIGMELPIVIKDDLYYGVIYKDNLYYVKSDEVETFENSNTDLKHTNAIATLVYHFVYDHENNEEKQKCLNMNSTICLSDSMFESHLKYIKDNNFYTATMRDVEMFVDGKIQLPEKTTVITIDDGNFVSASIKMLEKYDLHATLFLIGIAGSPEDYKSNNLEIHSHTWDMHQGGKCSGGQGSEIKCLPKETILEDLRKSRESLNNTTYFCWPFFEYNDYAIETLKEAGFTMAFIGGRRKITPGMNKMLLPRYGVINTTNVNDISRIIN